MDQKSTSTPNRFSLVSLVLVIAIVAILVAWRVERSNFEQKDPYGVLSLIEDGTEHSNLDSIVGTWKANHANCRYELEIESDGKFKRTTSRYITEVYAGTCRLRDDGLFLFTITQAGYADRDTGLVETGSYFAKFVGCEHGLRIGTDESGAMLMFKEQTNFKKNTGLPRDLKWNIPWRKQE